MFTYELTDYLLTSKHTVLAGNASDFSYSGYLTNGKTKIKVLPTSSLTKNNLLLELTEGQIKKSDLNTVFHSL